MTLGLRVTLTERDKASLAALASRAPHLVDAAWEERAGPGFVGIFSDALDDDTALDLKLRGVDVVRHVPGAPARHGWQSASPTRNAGAGGQAPPIPAARREAIPVVDGVTSVRRTRGLLEAVRPVPVSDAVPSEAFFFARIPAPAHVDVFASSNDAHAQDSHASEASEARAEDVGYGALRTLERLLLLERDDAHVGEVDIDGARFFMIRVSAPPLYLLYRAREELGEGVAVYARSPGAERVYCAWGFAHPLAALLDLRLADANRIALVDADGTTRLFSASFQLRPILDAVRPEIAARRDVLAPTAGDIAFPVRLRFGPADVADPELWILTPEQLFKLEAFVDASPADEVGRLLVSRLAGVDGRARYVVREAVRPQVARLGPRVAQLVGVAGFARAPALDNLYLPPGKRLVPALARDQVKALLGLDSVAAVVVDEDADGLVITSVAALEDAPLTRFTTWVATDRRAELDRLLEDAVLSFPGVAVEKHDKPMAALSETADEVERKKVNPRSPRELPQPKPLIAVDSAADAATTPAHRDAAQIRALAHALEQKVLSNSASDASAWRDLGVLKAELDDVDDACACLEVSLFVGEADGGVASTLAKLRRNDAVADKSLAELTRPDRLSQGEAALLAARVLSPLARHEAVPEDILQRTVDAFLRDDLLISRRMQWAVLHAIHARAHDALGATRAKEAVLGALNARGLSETLDLPRFVRTALALGGGDDTAAPVESARHEQLVQLDALFAKVVPQPLQLTNASQAYLRAIFAVGLGRLGGKAGDVIRSLQSELDAHDPPNRVLLGLYIARLSHFLTKGTAEAWKQEVDAALQSLARPEERRVVEWLVKRSQWLHTKGTGPTAGAFSDAPPPGVRPQLQRELAAAEAAPEALASTLARINTTTGLYDYEVAAATSRIIVRALATGRDELIRETLLVALRANTRLRILAHRIESLAVCVRAAVTLDDSTLVDQCLDALTAVARSDNPPSLPELLKGVLPALAALRRFGAAEASQRFLASMEAATLSSPPADRGPMLAALSDGFLQSGDTDKARVMVQQSFDVAMKASSYTDKFAAGKAMLETLTHWDLETRARQCAAVIAELSRFGDTFTTSRYFSTHQILITEQIVETIVDDVTLRSDRLQAYLDGEEQLIRRRVLQQWSALCGR